MRAAAWETAPRIALRNCSKEVGEKDSIYVTLVKWEHVQSGTYFLVESFYCFCKASASYEEHVTVKNFSAFLDLRRHKNCLIKSVPENI